MLRPFLMVALALSLAGSVAADEKREAIEKLIPWLLDETETLRGIRFADVIAAATGKRILPFDKSDAEDGRILSEISAATRAVLAQMNADDSPVRTARRVNEMSSHFETALRTELNARPGFTCELPRTAAGRLQRSGYPDLRLVDRATGRVIYLDPKLYAKGSRGSSFRTFYFEPKRETNKVTEDARHLIIGFEHERDPNGATRFTRWELVDLSEFRVRLKAEFEGSNADLYKREAILESGE